MKPASLLQGTLILLFIAAAGCASSPAGGATKPAALSPDRSQFTAQAKAEVEAHYAGALPEIQEYVIWTATQFGPGGLWVPENAFADLPPGARNQRVEYLATLLNDAEYGRHLCTSLADASALKDARLVPCLMRIAAYEVPGQNYDCRPKWIAVSALARQEAAVSVPLLISLVDHGNQNTRNWARAALARQTGQDFKSDKPAWAKWWQGQGHAPVSPELLKPYTPPATAR